MTVTDHRQVVAAKRDGKTLTPAEVEGFIEGYTRGDVSDALAASFLMACVLNGLDAAETLAMTRAMIASGETVSFTGLDRPTVDKHSTGGVSDGVTLVFAPLAAALGLAVAKLSGRGLGHTGGTLDKLESIPGLRTDLAPAVLAAQVAEVGCAVAAQSPNLVPADGALYALRDATATVPSIALIASSVMSKKLAVATDLILLDVKAGSGAFMKTPEEAERLAIACLDLATGWGRSARVAVTDMSQPLGDAVGNALDVAEAVELLQGRFYGRMRDLAVAFAAAALEHTGAVGQRRGMARADAALDDGSALERFRAMVEAQGGDPRVADDPWAVLPRAPVVRPLLADRGASSGRWTPRRSGSRAAPWAPGGSARATRSIPRWVSCCGRRSATRSRRANRSARSTPATTTQPSRRRPRVNAALTLGEGDVDVAAAGARMVRVRGEGGR